MLGYNVEISTKPEDVNCSLCTEIIPSDTPLVRLSNITTDYEELLCIQCGTLHFEKLEMFIKSVLSKLKEVIV